MSIFHGPSIFPTTEACLAAVSAPLPARRWESRAYRLVPGRSLRSPFPSIGHSPPCRTSARFSGPTPRIEQREVTSRGEDVPGRFRMSSRPEEELNDEARQGHGDVRRSS
ncbi:hypothetical protein KM043_006775 [Ampulex compressa]|nr:hypothetical protein KM043_006775 [Ampulex compressa]